MIKQNADLIAGGAGLGLIAGGIGALWAWPATLVVLGIGLVIAAAVIL